jgi:AcrR family transcriptional regulator
MDGPNATAPAAETDVPGLHPPRQKRSAESLERLLTTGIEVLAEVGYEGFTLQELCRRADATIGLIYRRFDSKSALVDAIQARALDQIDADERIAFDDPTAWEGLSLEETVERAVRESARIAHAHAPIIRAFQVRAAVDPGFRAEALARATLPRRFARVLGRKADEIPHADTERAITMTFWLANSAVDRFLTEDVWLHARPMASNDWDAFVDDIVRACRAVVLFGDREAR